MNRLVYGITNGGLVLLKEVAGSYYLPSEVNENYKIEGAPYYITEHMIILHLVRR